MRYARQEDLLMLAVKMQGSADGMCLADIEREFNVSRRTAAGEGRLAGQRRTHTV